MPDAAEVRAMFARVARRYDRANRLLSLGVDRVWRRAAVRAAGARPGLRVLDACTGTGDLALALERQGAEVTGADFTPQMLSLAADKARDGEARPILWVAGDTMALPFSSARFDAATVAFGIRNVQEPVAALRELARVVRPGGVVVVLEFARPRVPVLGRLYLFYFRRVLPVLGRWISGDREGAYDYLPESVMRFPEREAFASVMREAGLESPEVRLLTGGIAALYRGTVPIRAG